MKYLCVCLLAVASILPAWGQDGEEKEQLQSITDERRDLLLYGIDDQVIDLVSTLTEEKNEILAGEVFAAYKMSGNPKLKTAIFEYFIAIDFRGARDEAFAIVDSYEDYPTDLVSAAIRYLTDNPSSDLAERFTPLLDSPDREIARLGIKGIGLSEDTESADFLLEYLDDNDYPAELKPEIILALGELKNPVAVPRLGEILDDVNENATWRRYACASLGKIGDAQALPAIEKALYDQDAMLRSYAVGSLQFFDPKEVTPLLIAALKDSFWRVRVSAAQSLGGIGATEAVPILIFKGEKDPEMNVRVEAVRALGEIADLQSLDALQEIYGTDLTPPTLRVVAAEILAEKDLARSIDLFKKVVDTHWGRDTTRILERTAQILSRTESDLLAPFYSRFLESGDMVVMIYGIRGIAKNKILSLKDKLTELSGEGHHRSIRKEALAALEQLE